MGINHLNVMKQTLIFILFASLKLAITPTASAVENTAEAEPEYDLPTYEYVEYVTLPKPTRSPMPKVKSRLVGTKLKLRFTVTEDGKVEDIRPEKPLASYSDVERMTFANQTLDAVSRWRFKPARDANDIPVKVNVIMPVKVVKYGKIYRALASLDFETPKAKN